MMSYPDYEVHLPETLEEGVEVDLETPSTQPPLPQHGRKRSRTMVDLDPTRLYVPDISPSIHGMRNLRRSVSHMRLGRLQLSIPSAETPATPRSAESLESESETPQTAESSPELETPATRLASPIAGVVDLTKHVTTTSAYAVAHGGLSDIYLGEWHRGDEDGIENPQGKAIVVVAIKLLRIFTAKDYDDVRSRKKLNREVYVWHRLEHPNVVKLFGTSYHMSGRPAMVMQWYENGSATDYLAKKNPNADRIQLILDVARGLAYLHTLQPRPIVHADLKGNNVLITDEGRAVLSDFGLSKVVEDLGRPTGFTLSNPDVAAGPLRWQAPEFLESDDEPATLASDVWSFGCTAYELLTGQLPYSHRTRDPQIIRDMGNGVKPCGPPDMEQAALGRFDPRIRQLLDSCWSFSVADRPCMADVQSQLEVVAACTPASQPSTQEDL